MRIACPSCDAEYEVPESMLAGRSTVRCARCGEDWRPGAEPAAETLPAVTAPDAIAAVEEPAPPAPAPAPPAPLVAAPVAAAPLSAAPATAAPAERAPSLYLPPRERNAASSREPSGRAVRPVLVGWVVTVLVLGCALYAGYAYRTGIMASWPPSTRLYAALGLR